MDTNQNKLYTFLDLYYIFIYCKYIPFPIACVIFLYLKHIILLLFKINYVRT